LLIVIKDLRNTVDELNVESVSIAKPDFVNNIPRNIKPLLQLTFIDLATKLIICNGMIKYPLKNLRLIIIGEFYYSPTEDNEALQKLYRIKHNYYWENLKADIQRYIQQCLQCQLKKLVRVKIKQPMMITDLSRSSFNKIARML